MDGKHSCLKYNNGVGLAMGGPSCYLQNDSEIIDLVDPSKYSNPVDTIIILNPENGDFLLIGINNSGSTNNSAPSPFEYWCDSLYGGTVCPSYVTVDSSGTMSVVFNGFPG